MSLTMHTCSVRTFQRHLRGLANCLTKAKTLYQEKKYDEASLVNYRLFPDMFDFARQVRMSTMHACQCTELLSGVARPTFEDNEKTLEELVARVQKTIDYLAGVKAEQIDGTEGKSVVVKMADIQAAMTMRPDRLQLMRSGSRSTRSLVMSAMRAQPANAIVISNSSRNSLITRATPSAPSAASPQIAGRPIMTPDAPSASAMNTSFPLRTPPSTSIGTRPSIRRALRSSARMLVGAADSTRSPWFEIATPSQPAAMARSASSGCSTPFSTIDILPGRGLGHPAVEDFACARIDLQLRFADIEIDGTNRRRQRHRGSLDRCIDGKHHREEPGGEGTIQQTGRGLAIPLPVELEPGGGAFDSIGGLSNLGERPARKTAHEHLPALSRCGGGAGGFAIGVEQALIGHGCEENRMIERFAEEGDGRAAAAHVDRRPGNDVPCAQGTFVAPDAAVLQVMPNGSGQPRLRMRRVVAQQPDATIVVHALSAQRRSRL
jgi:hypothetical protein